MESTTETTSTTEIKLPKMCKEIRYYYRHREELAEKRRQRLLQDPDYQAKQLEKEEKKRAKEEERKMKEEEKKAKETQRQEERKAKAAALEEKRKKKATLLGVLPSLPPV